MSAGIPELRVRLADRSLLQTNPLLSVADLLLELASSRLTASQVLDLASREPVRRRFRFDDDDLSQVERWVVEMGVRWGLDGAHRSPWGLPDLAANTWSAGLDRLLLGVAMAEDDQRLFGGHCRSMMSPAGRLIWPVVSPNSSTGCEPPSTPSKGRRASDAGGTPWPQQPKHSPR